MGEMEGDINKWRNKNMSEFDYNNQNEEEVNNKVGSDADLEGCVFDLTDTDENAGGFEALPKGEYSAIVDSFTFGLSKKGSKMVTVCFEITSPEEFASRKIYDYYVLDGEAEKFGKPKLKKFFIRVAPDIDLSTLKLKEIEDNATVIGRECKLKLRVRKQKTGEYKGQTSNVIDDILVADNGSFI